MSAIWTEPFEEKRWPLCHWAQLDNTNWYKKGHSLCSFIVYFRYFQTDINTIFTSNKCENVHPEYGAGIRTHDLQMAILIPKPWLPIYFNLPLIRLTSPYSIQSPIRIDFSLFSYLDVEKKFYNIDTRGRQQPTRRRRRRHTKYASNVSEWETWNEKCWKSAGWLTERLSYE